MRHGKRKSRSVEYEQKQAEEYQKEQLFELGLLEQSESEMRLMLNMQSMARREFNHHNRQENMSLRRNLQDYQDNFKNKNYLSIKSKVDHMHFQKEQTGQDNLAKFQEKVPINRRVLNDYMHIVNKRQEVVDQMEDNFLTIDKMKQSTLHYFNTYYGKHMENRMQLMSKIIKPENRQLLKSINSNEQRIKKRILLFQDLKTSDDEIHLKNSLENKNNFSDLPNNLNNQMLMMMKKKKKIGESNSKNKLAGHLEQISKNKGYMIIESQPDQIRQNQLIMNEVQKFGSDRIKKQIFEQDMKNIIENQEIQERLHKIVTSLDKMNSLEKSLNPPKPFQNPNRIHRQNFKSSANETNTPKNSFRAIQEQQTNSPRQQPLRNIKPSSCCSIPVISTMNRSFDKNDSRQNYSRQNDSRKHDSQQNQSKKHDSQHDFLQHSQLSINQCENDQSRQQSNLSINPFQNDDSQQRSHQSINTNKQKHPQTQGSIRLIPSQERLSLNCIKENQNENDLNHKQEQRASIFQKNNGPKRFCSNHEMYEQTEIPENMEQVEQQYYSVKSNFQMPTYFKSDFEKNSLGSSSFSSPHIKKPQQFNFSSQDRKQLMSFFETRQLGNQQKADPLEVSNVRSIVSFILPKQQENQTNSIKINKSQQHATQNQFDQQNIFGSKNYSSFTQGLPQIPLDIVKIRKASIEQLIIGKKYMQQFKVDNTPLKSVLKKSVNQSVSEQTEGNLTINPLKNSNMFKTHAGFLPFRNSINSTNCEDAKDSFHSQPTTPNRNVSRNSSLCIPLNHSELGGEIGGDHEKEDQQQEEEEEEDNDSISESQQDLKGKVKQIEALEFEPVKDENGDDCQNSGKEMNKEKQIEQIPKKRESQIENESTIEYLSSLVASKPTVIKEKKKKKQPMDMYRQQQEEKKEKGEKVEKPLVRDQIYQESDLFKYKKINKYVIQEYYEKKIMGVHKDETPMLSAQEVKQIEERQRKKGGDTLKRLGSYHKNSSWNNLDEKKNSLFGLEACYRPLKTNLLEKNDGNITHYCGTAISDLYRDIQKNCSEQEQQSKTLVKDLREGEKELLENNKKLKKEFTQWLGKKKYKSPEIQLILKQSKKQLNLNLRHKRRHQLSSSQPKNILQNILGHDKQLNLWGKSSVSSKTDSKVIKGKSQSISMGSLQIGSNGQGSSKKAKSILGQQKQVDFTVNQMNSGDVQMTLDQKRNALREQSQKEIQNYLGSMKNSTAYQYRLQTLEPLLNKDPTRKALFELTLKHIQPQEQPYIVVKNKQASPTLSFNNLDLISLKDRRLSKTTPKD